MNNIKLLNKILNRKDKRILGALLALAVVVSIIEVVSITAIMAFISIATNFDIVEKNYYYALLYRWLECTSVAQFVVVLGCALVFFYVVRGLINIMHIYMMGRFAYTRYQRFATLQFSRYLRFSYQDYAHKNSATLQQSIFSYTGTMTQLVFALLTIVAELFTVICIYALLCWVNWKMTLVLSCFLGVMGFLLIRAFSGSVIRAGKRAERYALEGSKIFNESFGNYKLIKLYGHESYVADQFSTSAQGFSGAHIMYTVLQHAPRFILETAGFLLLVGIVLYVVYDGSDSSRVIPVVSLYALAFYRLLPSANKILSNINVVKFSQHALQGVYDFLQFPTENIGKQEISFVRDINVSNLQFAYQENKPVVHDVSFTIAKGERVAFVGPSGSGKSTLVDVLMGFHIPQQGFISIDGVVLDDDHRWAWRKKIGYIPQSIYLFDGTIADNVVFGRTYDEQKIIQALQKAYIYEFLAQEHGIMTRVGEGGITLSGGQRQRVAIARALYDDPDLLVLDEATSALDSATEAAIMEHIYALSYDVTLIVVAHRLSTVARCDTIYSVDHGRVTQVAYAHLVGTQPTLQQ